jgi:hypothetical protein
MELAVYHGAHIPGIKNPGMSTIPDEDTPWMRRDQPGFFGKSSYRAIFFQLVIGRGNVTQTTPQQPTQLTGSLFNIRKGNIIQFGGLTPTVSTGNTRPPTSVSNQPIGRPPAVIRPQQSGIVTSRPATVARPAVPATVARPAVPATVARPAVPATTPPKPAPAPAPSSANIQTVPAATAVQASVDKTNANTGQPDSLESQAQAFWQGVDDSKKQQISYDASQTEKQRAMYNQGNESQDKLTMEQNAEAFFEGVKDQQKGSASWDASRTDSQNEMYNLGWDNAKSGTCDMSKAAENNGWGYNHSTKASCK